MKNEITKENIKRSILNIKPLSKEEKEYLKTMTEEDKHEMLLFYDKIVQQLVNFIFEV
jgi:hypothetical protein